MFPEYLGELVASVLGVAAVAVFGKWAKSEVDAATRDKLGAEAFLALNDFSGRAALLDSTSEYAVRLLQRLDELDARNLELRTDIDILTSNQKRLQSQNDELSQHLERIDAKLRVESARANHWEQVAVQGRDAATMSGAPVEWFEPWVGFEKVNDTGDTT